MARGDMKFDTLAVANEIEILNRKEFEAVAQTVDFANVSTVADNGEKVVKAGTPINSVGKPVDSTPWTGAVGILLHDAYESHPQVAILKEGYVNKTRAEANATVTYDADLTTVLVAAGCRIVFE